MDERGEGEMEGGRELHGTAAFEGSGLTMRSPPVPSRHRTSNDLEELQLSVADGEVSLSCTTTVIEAESSLLESASDNSVTDKGESGRMFGPRLPSHVWRKMVRDKKVADGTWVTPVVWRKNQGLQLKHKKAAGKKRVAKTSASSAVVPAATEQGRGSGEASLPPTGNLPKGARVAGCSKREVSMGAGT